MLAAILILLGWLSRIIIHIPNFTPVISIALLSGMAYPKRHAVWVPVILMILSDLVIGLHSTVLFTWGAVAVIAFLGHSLKQDSPIVKLLGTNLWAALFFFLVTNFGTWMMDDLYPKTWEGLRTCYVMAIPFFRYTLLSTLIYSALLFGSYNFVAARVRRTRWARVLFTS